NQGPPAWTDIGFALAGAGGRPLLTGAGALSTAATNHLRLSHAPPLADTGLFCGLDQTNLPFKGGTLVPAPEIFIPRATDSSGVLDVPFVLPPGLPHGLALYFQFWVADAGAIEGFTASNGLR